MDRMRLWQAVVFRFVFVSVGVIGAPLAVLAGDWVAFVLLVVALVVTGVAARMTEEEQW